MECNATTRVVSALTASGLQGRDMHGDESRDSNRPCAVSILYFCVLLMVGMHILRSVAAAVTSGSSIRTTSTVGVDTVMSTPTVDER